MQQEAKAIQTNEYLSVSDIEQHLANVEYIMMATGAPEHFVSTPIHFTIFLNTKESLPDGVKEAVLEKFLDDYKIGKPAELLSQIMPVGFAKSNGHDTPMPMLIVKQQDRMSIPNTTMYVMDFLADSDQFEEAKVHKLTGWSYAYC